MRHTVMLTWIHSVSAGSLIASLRIRRNRSLDLTLRIPGGARRAWWSASSKEPFGLALSCGDVGDSKWSDSRAYLSVS